MTYLGAENIISPLGKTAGENFNSILSGESGVKEWNHDNFTTSMGKMDHFDLKTQAVKCINSSISKINLDLLKSGNSLLIISSVKGEIEELANESSLDASLINLKEKIAAEFKMFDEVKMVSNACISGVLALIVADTNIRYLGFDHVCVVGVDKISTFTLSGFESFFALSDTTSRPFDKQRNGINLGEGAASIFLSRDPELFEDQSFKFLGGSTANDANHISGPSRTGEGLYRTIIKTLSITSVKQDEIDFISAHGTGTEFNDEMESIAFERAGLSKPSLNSLKGYFGHTFGAAGLIETAICLQSMRNDTAPASFGYEVKGVSGDINVLSSNVTKPINKVLKTASGFGGCNASILISK